MPTWRVRGAAIKAKVENEKGKVKAKVDDDGVNDEKTGDPRKSLIRILLGGGASDNNVLMQCQSDLLNVPVIRPSNTETSALGAACLAG